MESEEEARKMRVVVFGAGYFGKNYIRELGRNCVLVVDPNKSARDEVQKRFRLPAFSKLPDDFDFDAAVIVTSPLLHYKIALPLLKKDKYVLVEKPLALTYEHAVDLASYPKCMAGLVYLYHPEVEKLRDRAACVQFSHIYSRRTNDGPVRPYLSAAWDLLPHDISIFNFVTQEKVKKVRGFGNRDYYVLQIIYPLNQAFAYASWFGGPKTRLVELVPSIGQRVIFDDLKVVLEEPPLTRMIRAFLSGEWDRCTGAEGAEVVRVLEEVQCDA